MPFFKNIIIQDSLLHQEGRKEPRTGGIIIANAESKSEIEQIIREDPFYIHQIADYEITCFIPSKYNDNFKFFIKD